MFFTYDRKFQINNCDDFNACSDFLKLLKPAFPFYTMTPRKY